MRRPLLLTASVLMCLSLGAPVTSTMAQTPAEAETRTVALGDANAAITFPATWRLWQSDASRDFWLVATDVARGLHCRVSALDSDETPGELAEVWVENARATDIDLVEGPEALELPAPEASHVAWLEGGGDPTRDVVHEYYVSVGARPLRVWCSGDEPPSDDFRSVVETVTPLTAETPESAPFDSRIEVPHRRVALSLPQEWLVQDWEMPRTQNGPSLFGEVIVLEGLLLTEDDAVCRIEALQDAQTASLTTDDWRTVLTDPSGTDEGVSVVVTDDSIPAGPAVRVEVDFRAGLSSYDTLTSWLVSDGDRLVSLTCMADAPPADRWRSIAETLEILPDSP